MHIGERSFKYETCCESFLRQKRLKAHEQICQKKQPSIKEIVERNTITDRNTFKLILFAYGNGISLKVFIEYLYTFILNTPSNIKKRTHQIHWIVTNINTHQHKWYYFDMYHRSFLLLNGFKKN